MSVRGVLCLLFSTFPTQGKRLCEENFVVLWAAVDDRLMKGSWNKMPQDTVERGKTRKGGRN